MKKVKYPVLRDSKYFIPGRGSKIVYQSFDIPQMTGKNVAVNRDTLKKMVEGAKQQIIKKNPDKNISYSITMWTGKDRDDKKPFSTRYVDIKEKIHFKDDDDEDYGYEDGDDPMNYYHFNINYQIRPRAGGNSPLNDCLYDCLVFYGIHSISAQALKTYLHLKRNDKVHIDLISALEKHSKLHKWKINVRGDELYISDKIASETMNLLLVDGHYTVDKKVISDHWRC